MQPAPVGLFHIADRIETGNHAYDAIVTLTNNSPQPIDKAIVKYHFERSGGEVESRSVRETDGIGSGERRQILNINAYHRKLDLDEILVIQGETTYVLTGYRKRISAGGSCFIATAIYGSERHRTLTELRLFRDRVLLRSSLGARAVRRYYVIGPKVAAALERRRAMRLAVAFVVIPSCETIALAVWLWRSLRRRA